MKNTERNNTNNLIFVGGIIAGAAVGWWLNSDKGRKFRTESGKIITDQASTLKDVANEKYIDVKHAASEKYSEVQDTVSMES